MNRDYPSSPSVISVPVDLFLSADFFSVERIFSLARGFGFFTTSVAGKMFGSFLASPILFLFSFMAWPIFES